MHLGGPSNKKSTLIVRSILGGLALIFIIAFWGEIRGVFSLFGALIMFILGFPIEGLDQTIRHAIPIILFNCFFGFGLVFFLWLFLISAQALLPVNNLQEVYRTAWHLWLFITRRHGTAVFVKDGVLVSTREDEKHQGHGVVVVDFNSAVVLEERDVAPGLSRLATISELSMLNILGLSDPPVSPRAHGAGIVFTRPNERIRGVVDLRRQFRIQPKVPSYTKEGIELKANILSIFTVGDDPDADALQVTPISHRQRAEDWRVAVFLPSKQGEDYLYLAQLNDELDSADREEIAQNARLNMGQQSLQLYSPLPPSSRVPRFDPERVFAAVFAQARSNEQEAIPWTELPTRVAAGFYRDLLPRIDYDELYEVKSNGKSPLQSHKRTLRLFMRNNGVLAYRAVYHCSGSPLLIGVDYRKTDLLVSPVRQLTTPKLLRDRGIRIVFGSFGDPFPVSNLIYQQRLDSWRANWEKDLNLTQANNDLDAMRTRTRALINTQQDLKLSLKQLFDVTDYSDEALALRLIEALEAASADPKTRQLLPGNTIDLMRYIHTTLLSTQSSSRGSQAPSTGSTGVK
jgi:hypothetical protein